jgi:hypothetical protein
LDPVELTFRVPEGTTHLSGEQTLVFDLDRLGPGEGGIQEVTVSIDQSASLGTQLAAVTELTEVGSGEVSRMTSWTPLSDTALLTTVEVNPDPAQWNEFTTVNITVTNPTQSEITSDVLLQLPLGIQTIDSVDRSEGAVCGASCTAGGTVSWVVEDLGAGESEVLWVRPQVLASNSSIRPPLGTLLSFAAEVRATNEVTQWAGDTTRVHQP